MAQRPTPDAPTVTTAQACAPDDQEVVRPSAEFRTERSRFSRLLARFGLGELTDPILRPTKHPAGRDRAG